MSQKNDKKARAKELWNASDQKRGTLKAIAVELGVSDSVVRKWKSEGKWETRPGAGAKIVTFPETHRNVTANERTPESLPPEVVEQMVGSLQENEELNPQQKEFCLYHVLDSLSKTDAAIKAGYSKNTAGQIGYQLLQKTSIREEVARLHKIKLESLVFTVDELVEFHVRAFRADMTKYVTFGTVRDEPGQEDDKADLNKLHNVMFFKNSDTVDGTLINKISVSKDGASLSLVDKRESARFLAQYLGANKMDQHRMEMDRKRLELENRRAGYYGTGDGADPESAPVEEESEDVVIYIPENGRDDDG